MAAIITRAIWRIGIIKAMTSFSEKWSTKCASPTEHLLGSTCYPRVWKRCACRSWVTTCDGRCTYADRSICVDCSTLADRSICVDYTTCAVCSTRAACSGILPSLDCDGQWRPLSNRCCTLLSVKQENLMQESGNT